MIHTSIGHLYAETVPTISLFVSMGAVWYARDKAVREAQALPLQETHDGLWKIKNQYDVLDQLLGTDRVGLSYQFLTQKERFPSVPAVPDELQQGTVKLRTSKQQLVSPSEQRMENVIAAVERLNSTWVVAHNATSRDLNNHTAQSLGFAFGALERALDDCSELVERYLQVVSDVNKRAMLRRWYYKRHWRLTQSLLDLRIRRVNEQGPQ
jgi:hypothetical protein